VQPSRAPDSDSGTGSMASSSFSHPRCLLSQHLPQNVAFHDNCCSYHITGNPDLIYDLKPLSSPIPLDGVNGGVLLTHTCKFRCIPDINNLNSGYYAKGVITLFSTGYMQRGGCSYTTSNSRLGIDIFLPNGDIFDNPTLSANNLLPVSDTLLNRTIFSSNPTTRVKAYALKHGSTPTTEQLKRCDDVERELHRLSFPTDESLIQDLQHGKLHWVSHLTADDVRLNRALRGPCPHQHARDKIFTSKTSLSSPSSKPGDQVQSNNYLFRFPAALLMKSTSSMNTLHTSTPN